MNNKILFMIINNEVKYSQDPNIDHRDWYNSLGFDSNNFDNIVRGFIMDNKIVFYKGINFNYDEEVIKAAKIFGPSIISACNNPFLEVYCGVVTTQGGSKWEPVLHLKKEELVVEQPKVKPKPKEIVETGPVLEFKNDYNDEIFCKRAIHVTIIILVLTIIVKIILFSKREILQLSNPIDVLLAFLQIILLSLTIYGYHKKLSITKYLGLAASILLILTFNIWDVVLGIGYFIFTIDQGYFIKLIDTIKQKTKGKGK